MARTVHSALALTLASLLAIPFVACGEQRVERKGGDAIPDLLAGSSSSPSGGGGSVDTSESGAAGLAEGGALDTNANAGTPQP